MKTIEFSPDGTKRAVAQSDNIVLLGCWNGLDLTGQNDW